MNLSFWWVRLSLLIIGCYLILNYGFMQLRIPPVASGGVPIGELFLIVSLVTISPRRSVNRLGRLIPMTPLLLWWTTGVVAALCYVPYYGMWALRDATHVIESLYLLVGFGLMGRPGALEAFFKWLPTVLVIGGVYALGYPVHETLQSFSPTIVTGAGYQTPILFSYTSTAGITLMGAAYLLLFYQERHTFSVSHALMAFALIGFTVFLFQSRTIYLQVLAILALFFAFRRELFGEGIYGMVFLGTMLAMAPLLDVKLIGRLGQATSLEFLWKHFMAIFGAMGSGVESAASGVSQRIGWWTDLYNRWTDDVFTFIFGLGFGVPLTNFGYIGGMIVREPHNSFVSTVARMGFIGGVLFLTIHVILVGAWLKAYRAAHRRNMRLTENRLLILMVYTITIWTLSIGEDAFEKPYNAIPYYFFWGVTLRYITLIYENIRLAQPVPDAHPDCP